MGIQQILSGFQDLGGITVSFPVVSLGVYESTLQLTIKIVQSRNTKVQKHFPVRVMTSPRSLKPSVLTQSRAVWSSMCVYMPDVSASGPWSDALFRLPDLLLQRFQKTVGGKTVNIYPARKCRRPLFTAMYAREQEVIVYAMVVDVDEFPGYTKSVAFSIWD